MDNGTSFVKLCLAAAGLSGDAKDFCCDLRTCAGAAYLEATVAYRLVGRLVVAFGGTAAAALLSIFLLEISS
jgi:hypothetical protein